ncbi:glycosyl hydrolase family 18 protein [Halobacillus salinus]|uniref:glycosyl hydrolase family 18 protein n=1 Tax=Halobacillus salinus TaxID=192814 RepID=UPI0009A59DD5|nr:glycosyl hydrolase family 18 protein [Halobacillus salinus]
MKKKKLKAIFLIGILTFLVIAGIVVATLYPFPSSEKVVGINGSTSIIYQNEVVEGATVTTFDRQSYVPFSFIKEKVDSNIVYDEASQSVIVTMPENVYQLPTDELKYFMNQKEHSLHFPVTKSENNQLFLAVSWLEQVYPVYLHRTKHALVFYENGSNKKMAEIKSSLEDYQTKLRKSPSVMSPYYINLEPGDKVYIIGEEGRFFHALSENGTIGYLPKDSVENLKSQKVDSKTEKQKRRDIHEIDEPIHVAWDAFYNPDATPTEVKPERGIDVLSPTWFHLIDGEGNIENYAKKEYVDSAHENGIDVWALFSNSFDPDLTKQVLSSFEKRQDVIRQLLDYSRVYNLDGINIDFENVYLDDGPLFTQFVREFTPLAHQAGLVVSVDVAFPDGSERWSQFLEHEQLADASDYMMVMAYDEHWANSPNPGSVASLPWVRENMNNLLELVPNDKVLLGIPLYTRLWTVTKLDNGETDVSSESMTMEEAKKWMADRKIEPEFKSSTGQNVVTYEDENKTYYIWLEDKTSLQTRIQLMKEHNLAGIATWSKSFADKEAWRIIDSAMQQ